MDPKWLEKDKELVADCTPDGIRKSSAGTMSVAQNAALLRAHAHIDELRATLLAIAPHVKPGYHFPPTEKQAEEGCVALTGLGLIREIIDRQEPPKEVK